MAAWQELLLENMVAPAAFLALLWLTAGRPSDIARLRTADVRVKDNVLSVYFREGKGVQARGQPFTVFADAGVMTSRIKTYIISQKQTMLFPNVREMYDKVRSFIRKVQPIACLRSLRRSTIEWLSKNGVPEEVIMEFSNHATRKMLRRYLGWGQRCWTLRTAMVTASACLA